MNPQTDVIYVAFKESFLQQKMSEWEKEKEITKVFLNELIVFLAGFILSFVYLIVVIGRTSFKDKEIHFHVIDKLYNDLNIVIVVSLTIDVYSDDY